MKKTNSQNKVCKYVMIIFITFLFNFQILYAESRNSVYSIKNSHNAKFSNSKIKSSSGILPFENIQGLAGVGSVSSTSLSSNYSISLISSDLFNGPYSSEDSFTLKAIYNSNNSSDFWGIGSGWTLNIPYITFSNEWETLCKGSFDDKGKCEFNKDADVIKESVSGYPKEIIVNNSNMSGVFKQSDKDKTAYYPLLKSSISRNFFIKASKTNGNIYTFTLLSIKNPNKKTQFNFDGNSNSSLISISSDNIDEVSNKSIKVTYNQKENTINISGYYNNALISGAPEINISGLKKLNFTGPKDIPNTKVTTGCFISNIKYCPDGSPSGNCSEGFAPDLKLPVWNMGDFIKTPITYYNYYYYYDTGHQRDTTINKSIQDCPTAEDSDITTAKFFENNPLKYNISPLNDSKNITIKGTNLKGKEVVVNLKSDQYKLTYINPVSFIGMEPYIQIGTANYVGNPSQTHAIKTYMDVSHIGMQNFDYTVRTLKSIDWNLSSNTDPYTTINLNYNPEYHNITPDGISLIKAGDNSIWAFSPYYMNKYQRDFYSVYSKTPVPLLASVSGTSNIGFVPSVNFQYSSATYNINYSDSALKDNTNFIFKNEGYLNAIMKILNLLGDSESPNTFMYVSTMQNNGIITNYSWGSNGNNFYKQTTGNEQITDTNSDLEYYRALTTNYAISGMSINNSNNGQPSFTVIITRPELNKEYDTYNKYGLLTQKKICSINSKDDSCLIQGFQYLINADGQYPYIDKYDGIYDQISNETQSIQLNDGKEHQLSSISYVYNALHNLTHVYSRGVNNQLLNATVINYVDPNSEDSKILSIKSYVRPYINKDKIMNSRLSTTTSYQYKNVIGGDKNSYKVIDTVVNNIGDKKTTKKYDYDDTNNLTSITTCVNTNECNSDYTKDDSRQSIQNTLNYDDTKNALILGGTRPGSGKEIDYILHSNLPKEIYTSNGEIYTYSYDDYGRLQSKKIEQVTYDNAVHTISNDTYAYNKNNDNFTVEKTDMYGHSSLATYNKYGEIIKYQTPNINTSSNDPFDPIYKTYEYNINGQIDKEQYYNGSNELSNEQFKYDFMNRIVATSKTTTSWKESMFEGDKVFPEKNYHSDYEYSYNFPSSNNANYSTSTKVTSCEKANYESIEDMKLCGSEKTDIALGSKKSVVSSDSNILTSTVTTYDPSGEIINSQQSNVLYNTNTDTKSSYPFEVTYITHDQKTKTLFFNSSLTLDKIIIGNATNKNTQTLAYIYDSLYRVTGVKYNNFTEPYHYYYDDNANVNQVAYDYFDNNVRSHRVTQYNYSEACLYKNIEDKSYLCDYKGFNIDKLDSIDTYKNSVAPSGDIKKYTNLTGKILSDSFNYIKSNQITEKVIDPQNINNNITNIEDFNDDLTINSLQDMRNDNSGTTSHSEINYNYINGIIKSINSTTSDTTTFTPKYDDSSYLSGIKISADRYISSNPQNHFLKETILDPANGLPLLTKITSPKNTYNIIYHYDAKNRLDTETYTNDEKTETSDYYERKTYTYYDTNGTNEIYGALKSIETEYNPINPGSNKDSIKQTFKYYTDSGKLYTVNTNVTTRNIVGIKNIGLLETYSYDGMGRLAIYRCKNTGSDEDKNLCPIDSYSDGSNINSRQYFYNDNNQITSITTNGNKTLAFVYDKNDETHLKSIGNLLTLNYDDLWNRLASLITSTGTDSYKYNLAGRLTSITSQGVGSNTQNNIDIHRGLRESITGISLNNLNQRHYYGDNFYKNEENKLHYLVGGYLHSSMDIPVMKDQDTLGVNHIIRGINGKVLAQNHEASPALYLHSYTPYGSLNDYSYLRNYNILRKDNQETIYNGDNGALTIVPNKDSFSGVQYQLLGSRVYIPEISRFMQHDTESPFGVGGPSGFLYGFGNPVGFSDPSGHFGSIFNLNVSNSPFNIESPAIKQLNQGATFIRAMTIAGIVINLIPGILSLGSGLMSLANSAMSTAAVAFTSGDALAVAASASPGIIIQSSMMGIEATITFGPAALSIAGIEKNNSALMIAGQVMGSIGAIIDIGSLGLGRLLTTADAIGDLEDSLSTSTEENITAANSITKNTDEDIGEVAACFIGNTLVMVKNSKKSKSENPKVNSHILKKIKGIKIGDYVVVS
ncbi:hypothetical protein [Francisella sp. 19X1-34]|uniref:RHS repeat domain-containing protein n=1 Tax=Francisella sp. 19X1-34 TaxID=3087177 RepID=UPI002E35EDCC|nr:hypothetical protein [Francisella sp. 19X1-34]MED7789464.1 hypothetical protein [Francisella sp. 19X1-34]